MKKTILALASSILGSISILAQTNPSANACLTPVAPIINGVANVTWYPVSVDTLKNIVSGIGGGAITVTATGLSAKFKVTWDNTALYLLVPVTDDTLANNFPSNPSNGSAVEIFIDGNNTKGTSYTTYDHQYVFRWNDATVYEYHGGASRPNNPAGVSFSQGSSPGGYLVEIMIDWTAIGVSPSNGKRIGLDVNIDGHDNRNGSGRDAKIAWSETKDLDYTNPSYFGTLQLDSVSCGTTVSACLATVAPVINGTVGSFWTPISADTLKNAVPGIGGGAATIAATRLNANFKITWDDTALYLLIPVTDDTLVNNFPSNPSNGSAVEIFVDGNNTKLTSYSSTDHQYLLRWNDPTVYEYHGGIARPNNPAGVTFAQGSIPGGFSEEVKITWAAIGVSPFNSKLLGLDVEVDGHSNANGSGRDAKIAWAETKDVAYTDPAVFGTLQLDSVPCEVIPTGLPEASSDQPEIAVYPNPFSNSTTLLIRGTATGNFNISVSDIRGRVIYQGTLALLSGQEQMISLPFDNLNNGIYFLRLGNDGIVKMMKLVKD